MTYVAAVIFCFGMFFSVFFIPLIGELDDVRVAQTIGLPIALISTVNVFVLHIVKAYKFSNTIILINLICLGSAIIGTFEGMIDLVTFNFHTYHGHQGNNYKSIDLIIICAACTLFLISNICGFLGNRKMQKNNK